MIRPTINVSLAILAGFAGVSAFGQSPSMPQVILIDSPGSTNVFSGELAATVSVSAEGSPVEIERRFNNGSSDGVTTVSNPKWKAAKGWLVCVQSPDLIWAYDGNGCLDITQITKLGTATKNFESLAGKVPAEVLDRLPENLKKAAPKAAQ